MTRRWILSGVASVVVCLVLAGRAATVPIAQFSILAVGGPVGLVAGQGARATCQNNFAPQGARMRLSFGDVKGEVLADSKIVHVPFGKTASVDLTLNGISATRVVPRLQVWALVRNELLETSGIVPGASFEVFDLQTGQTSVHGILVRLGK